MKKYITTLAVMAFAIAGCTQQPELTGDTTSGEDAPKSADDIETAEDGGENDGGADAAAKDDPNNPANKK
jgi:hypothetical protein